MFQMVVVWDIFSSDDADAAQSLDKNDDDEDDEIGGLFRILKEKSESSSTDRLVVNKTDCTKCHMHDVTLDNIEQVILNFLKYLKLCTTKFCKP